MSVSDEHVAKICHEANRAHCEGLGDTSQVPWDEAPLWQRESAVNGVRGWRNGEITSPEQSHELWMKEKLDAGWVYGFAKNEDAKTHPCLVLYMNLSEEQRRKNAIFAGVVRAFV